MSRTQPTTARPRAIPTPWCPGPPLSATESLGLGLAPLVVPLQANVELQCEISPVRDFGAHMTLGDMGKFGRAPPRRPSSSRARLPARIARWQSGPERAGPKGGLDGA